MKRILSLALAALAGLGLAAGSAVAENAWPARPVQIVVPYPPGGTVDSSARLVAQYLQGSLGQPVIVENRAGAAGSIGSEYVARATPDGYTLVWGTVSSHAINKSLYPKLRYDNVRDFAPITLLMEQPLMIAVPVSSPIKDLPDLVAALKEGKALTFGSAGVGTTGHLTTELMKNRIGGKITHVGYKGSNPMLTDLVGGHIDVGVDNLPATLAQVKAGKLRAIAVTSAKPSALAPDVPVLAGVLPGVNVVAWQGLFAPAGTPPAVLDRIERDVAQALNQPEIREKLTNAGNTPIGMPRAQFAEFVTAETDRWAEMVRISGARIDE